MVWISSARYINYFIHSIAIIGSIFFLINWSIYMIIAWLVGSLLSLVIILSSYYCLMRHVVCMLAFPGVVGLFKRSLEYEYCKSMCSEVLRSVRNMKDCIELVASI